MKHDGNLSLTAIVVQMQKTILQLSARVEALEANAKAQQARIDVLDAREPVIHEPVIQQTIVKNIIHRPPAPSRASDRMADMCKVAAARHRVLVADIRGPNRTRAIVDARKEFCTAALAAGLTSTQIGNYLNRDHTTVLHLAGRLKKTQGAQS